MHAACSKSPLYCPFGHCSHMFGTPVVFNPGWHAPKHSEYAGPLFKPVGHSLQASHVATPSTGDAVPAGQAWQCPTLLAPLQSKTVPAAHGMHSFCPSAPFLGLYVPASHFVHVFSPPSWYEPAGHCLCQQYSLPAYDTLPSAQTWHSRLPLIAFSPAGQSRHLVSLFVLGEYFPHSQY